MAYHCWATTLLTVVTRPAHLACSTSHTVTVPARVTPVGMRVFVCVGGRGRRRGGRWPRAVFLGGRTPAEQSPCVPIMAREREGGVGERAREAGEKGREGQGPERHRETERERGEKKGRR